MEDRRRTGSVENPKLLIGGVKGHRDGKKDSTHLKLKTLVFQQIRENEVSPVVSM